MITFALVIMVRGELRHGLCSPYMVVIARSCWGGFDKVSADGLGVLGSEASPHSIVVSVHSSGVVQADRPHLASIAQGSRAWCVIRATMGFMILWLLTCSQELLGLYDRLW